MAYQAGASLGQFWDAMLTLRSQRLKEQELKQAQQNRMMEMAQQTSRQIGSSILGAMQQGKTDTLANQMMEQTYGGAPRAGAVDVPWSDKEMAGKAFTGGAEELQMRMAMEKQQQAIFAERALTDYRKMATDKQAWSMAPDLGKAFNRTNAYTARMDVLNESMTKAFDTRNKALYENTASGMNSLHEAYMQTNPNTKIPPPKIPPFVHPDELKAIQEAQQGITELRNAPAPGGSWIPETAGKLPGAYGALARQLGLGNVDMPGQTAAEAMKAREGEIGTLEKAMKNLPGAEEYFKSTPQARATAGGGAMTGSQRAPGQIVGGFPLGEKRVNPQTKEWIIWDGTGWKPLK